MTNNMFKAIIKIMLFFITIISPLFSLAQHHLYFYIPECPNTVGIESTQDIDFVLSPVPAENYINLQFGDTFITDESSTISIINSNGRTVQEFHSDIIKAGGNAMKIDVSYLKQGLYIIRYTDTRRILSKKIVITG